MHGESAQDAEPARECWVRVTCVSLSRVESEADAMRECCYGRRVPILREEYARLRAAEMRGGKRSQP